MYREPNCKQSVMVNKTYKIIKPARVRCCGTVLSTDSRVTVRYNTSKKIVLIKVVSGIRGNKVGGYHKINMSTLRQCGEEIYE